MSKGPSAPPLVSVLIPAFNAESTLQETVQSALASTYRTIEVIIVDDGSTDRTAEIAQRLSESEPRVKLVRRANGGLAAALNTGFAASMGDYVARLDADDLWHPTKLERQLEVFRRNGNAALVYTHIRYIDEDGRVMGDAPTQVFPPRALCRSLYETLIGAGSSGLVKRSAWIEAGGCDEDLRILEDLLLQIRISARHEIAYVPQYLVGYRVRPGSLSKDVESLLKAWYRVRRDLPAEFPRVPSFVHDWAHGSRVGQMAESFAWRGEYGRCAALLAEALRYDPQWTLRFLAYRSWRFVRRKFGAGREFAAGPKFQRCDPERPTALVQFGLPAEGGPLKRLNQRRARRLERLDRTLRPRD